LGTVDSTSCFKLFSQYTVYILRTILESDLNMRVLRWAEVLDTQYARIAYQLRIGHAPVHSSVCISDYWSVFYGCSWSLLNDWGTTTRGVEPATPNLMEAKQNTTGNNARILSTRHSKIPKHKQTKDPLTGPCQEPLI